MKNSRQIHYKLVITVFVAASLSLVFPSFAQAHAEIVTSSPLANSVIGKMPKLLIIQANEGVTFSSNSVQLLDAKGKILLSNSTEVKSNSIELALEKKYLPGYYVVRYKIISADEHVVLGSYGFILGKVKVLTRKNLTLAMKSLDPAGNSDLNSVKLDLTIRPLANGSFQVACLGVYQDCILSATSSKYKAPFTLKLKPGESGILVLPTGNSFLINAEVRVSLFAEKFYQGQISL